MFRGVKKELTNQDLRTDKLFHNSNNLLVEINIIFMHSKLKHMLNSCAVNSFILIRYSDRRVHVVHGHK